MITIAFKYKDDGNPVAFRILGHAGFARRGKDIVCAAVSALVINTINSIEAYTEDTFVCEANEKQGYTYFELTEEPSAEALLLLKVLKLGLEGILNDGTYSFIKFVQWEV